MTDDELRGWNNPDTDINDDLDLHFETWGRWDCYDIADEARRVNNVMFEEDVEKGSPRDAIITAAVMHSTGMVYAAMAAAIGVDVDLLRCVVEQWSENQDNLPEPVSIDRFMELIKETKEKFDKAKLIA